MQINPILAADFYKVGHVFQYPAGTTEIYSNLTARSAKLGITDKVVNYGIQGFILDFLIAQFNRNFFSLPKELVISEYQRRVDTALGLGSVTVDHIAALHDLGYLPVEIKALPEGSIVEMGVPLLTIRNTHTDFFWVTNYLETALSAELWKKIVTATTAYEYRKLLTDYAKQTGSPLDFVLLQAHDFSMRGMSGIEDAAASGSAHLVVGNLGTDTIPAIEYLENFYDGRNTFVGCSVPATEHSVMCAGGEDDEKETIRRLITEVYPKGIVSIVSDTWDFWNTISVTAAELKEEILSRQVNEIGLAKVVFRPDSGDPVKIICGTGENNTPEGKGAVEVLWDIFGGEINESGFKVLNPRVGLIYGDSITLARAKAILEGLKQKGFASCNIVFGVGSYTYQYVTRDTYSIAMKATHAVINGENKPLFKNPKTDNGTKKSAKGYLRVEFEDGKFVCYDNQTFKQAQGGLLKTVFLNGVLKNYTTVEEIRSRIQSTLI